MTVCHTTARKRGNVCMYVCVQARVCESGIRHLKHQENTVQLFLFKNSRIGYCTESFSSFMPNHHVSVNFQQIDKNGDGSCLAKLTKHIANFVT